MLDRKFLTLTVLALCALVLMGAYNRPYRWWNALFSPLNVEDMNEQIFIKPFEVDSLRDPVAGTVSVDQWEPVPNKIDLMTKPAEYADFKNPVSAGAESIKQGEELYNVYCWPCHGTGMSPDPDKFSPVKAGRLSPTEDVRWSMPAADLNLVQNYSDEHIFTVITHGSAIMKRMDYHLSPEERWHVVNYVRSLIVKHQNK